MTSPTLVSDLDERERLRLKEQVALDSERSAKDRNLWGQFATPPALAEDITEYALYLHSDSTVRFLEPSCGSGAFFSALLRGLSPNHRLASACAVELDERFAALATRLWGDAGLQVVQDDYTSLGVVPEAAATLLIANPPYVRHHHMTAEAKAHAIERCVSELGLRPSGLTGLYVYFMLLSHRALAPGAISAWLIPSEFMDVNYGRTLKTYLSTKVTLRRVHRFDASDVQFDDALVTSAVVVFENKPPEPTDLVEFTHGAEVAKPRHTLTVPVSALDAKDKWSAHFREAGVVRHSDPVLADYFRIRRGIATGATKFFVMSRQEAEERGFKGSNLKPILPGPRYVKSTVIDADSEGYPLLERQLVVIDASEPLEALRRSDPKLAEYLDGADEKVRSGYLVRKRLLWYKQEQRPAPPFLLTYMGRGVDEAHPFRFILNHSQAVATNMFLMLYPTPVLQRYLDSTPNGLEKVHQALLSLTAEDLRNGGRVYGGGLHKMEPKELAALRAAAIQQLSPELLSVEAPLELPFG